MTEAQRQEWNRAIAEGDPAIIEALADQHLLGIHQRQLDDWRAQHEGPFGGG